MPSQGNLFADADRGYIRVIAGSTQERIVMPSQATARTMVKCV